MGKRNKIGRYYVERDRHGRFKNWVSIGKSLKRDRRVKAKTITKSGYGHRGDHYRRRGFLRRLPNSYKKIRVRPHLVER